MSNAKTNNYQSLFVTLAIKRLPHHIALATASKFRLSWVVAALDKYAKKHYINTVQLPAISEASLQDYAAVAQNAQLWHGSGRYQHSENGMDDVLNSILSDGSLKPAEDAYAIFVKGEVMHSISLTPLRIIARSYADSNGKGYKEANRYGDALMWVSYFYGLFYARLYTLDYFRLRKYYKEWHSLTHDENGHNTWGKKTSKSAENVWDIFGLGSDIPGNYPIIFGIKNVSQRVELTGTFDKCEVRTSEPILLEQISHIEVPQEHIASIKKLLRKHGCDLPVLPIEAGEVAASRTTFSKLLGY